MTQSDANRSPSTCQPVDTQAAVDKAAVDGPLDELKSNARFPRQSFGSRTRVTSCNRVGGVGAETEEAALVHRIVAESRMFNISSYT
jgi:hypothetical protein